MIESTYSNTQIPFAEPGANVQPVHRDPIPGTPYCQVTERDDNGTLMRLSVDGHTYVQRQGNEWLFGDRFARLRHIFVPAGMLRHVRTPYDSWQEFYKTDSRRLPISADGMYFQRDERGRVSACEGHDQRWNYRFNRGQLTGIAGPFGERHILRDRTEPFAGRPLQYTQSAGAEGQRQPATVTRHIQYDSHGRRTGLPELPPQYQIDSEGRLRALLSERGEIDYLFLWDGYNCLARIAGDPAHGGAIDTVYSLDMTGTPVRLIGGHSCLRIPRDAYGENLSAYPKHPGLFGGTQYAGYVWLRSRTIDPRSASFDAPDPLHGGKDDPRRSLGYQGGLPVETPVAGPYAVCQHDPLTFLDPTGEIAWYYVLSTLTWAFPNNILSWIGLEATGNFWGTFFTGSWSDWADAEHWQSERLNIGGIQRQSFFAPSPGGAFTTQHLIWARHDYLDEKRRATVFDPGGTYQPALYGSMLRVVPDNGPPFLLRGQMQIGNINQPDNQLWVRAGGPATPIAPGQRVPSFPEGGLHFPFRDTDILGPQSATCTELTATASVGIGTVNTNTTVTLPSSLSLNPGDLLLLEDTQDTVEIIPVLATIPEGGNQIVRLERQVGFSDTVGITVTQVLASTWTETLVNNGMPASHYLDAGGTGNAYQVDDALRLNDGTDDYSAQIRAFETKVTLDDPLSGSPTSPLGIFTLTVNTGTSFDAQINSPNELEFLSGTTPSAGDFIVVSDGSNTLAVVVGSGTGAVRSVDRDLSGLSGPPVTWQSAARGSELGTQTRAITSGELTYAPTALNTVPGAGDHLVIDSGPTGSLTTQLRTVTAVDYHALILKTSATLPSGTSFTVARHPVGTQFNNRTLSQPLMLNLTQGTISGAVALQMYQLGASAPAVNGMNLLEPGLDISGSSASRLLLTPSRATLTPNQPVTVQPAGTGSNDEPLVTERVRRDLLLNFPLTSSHTSLEVVTMAPQGFAYDSVTASPSRVIVSPLVSSTGTPIAVDMPRFFTGECVEVVDAGSGDAIGQYRIADVPEGTLLELQAGPPLPAAGATVRVQKLGVMASGNGNRRSAINGALQSANSAGESQTLRADIWRADAFPDGTYIGVVDGNQTLPFVVRELYPTAAATIGATNQITLSGAAGSTVNTGDHLLLSWQDSGGAHQAQTFAITSITGNTLGLAPQHSGTPVTLATSGSNAIACLFETGRFYDVTVPGTNQVDVSPGTMAGVSVGTPQFSVNEPVLLFWRNGSGQLRSQQFQVSSVAGSLLDLSVTNPSPGLDISPADSDVTIARIPQLEVTFTTAPTSTGPVDLRDIAPTAVLYIARFTRQDNQSLLMDNVGTLNTTSGDTVLVVPLEETGSPQAGRLSSGTGKVPEDPENTAHGEHDRHQMLVEHELRHTEQYLWWGPMFLTLVPLWPVELGLELGTDIEQPDYGPFQEASLELPDGSGAMKITFASGDGGFSVDQQVQLSQGSQNATLTLRAPAGGETGFRVARASEFSNGTVYVRAVNSFPDWYRVVHGSWFRTLTIGGLTQLAASLTHGLFFQIIGRFFYMIYRGIQLACCDDRKEGVVEGGQRQVRLNNPGERNDLNNHELLLVQEPQDFVNVTFSGIDTVVRSRQGAITDEGVITLSAPLSWSDGTTVNIGPYQSRTPGQLFDWKTYYPAVVQSDNHHRLQLLPIGDDSLSLQPFDRLRVIAEGEFYGMFSSIRTVIAVVSDDTVEVDQAVTGSGTADTQLTVRVAKIGTEDPFDFLDTVGVDELTGGGWLRWATDPFGQLHFATQPTPGSVGDIFARAGKYIMGTKAWTNPILLTSRYFAEAMTKELHNVSLEQDASEQSGELYTPIGRIYGEARVNGTNATMAVGDIARYWYFGFEFSNVQNTLAPIRPPGTRQTDPGLRMDDPGNALLRDQIVYCQQTGETPGSAATNPVNLSAQSAAATSSPGLDMADAFWLKQPGNPGDVSQTAIDRRMVPNDLGLVPQSPQLQLSSAAYLAFTQATGANSHRATVDDAINGGDIGRDAQDSGSQRLFYTITVNDVTVNLNNVAVNDGDTITLLRTQRIAISVSDEGTKQYAVLVTRPSNGPVVRAAFAPNKTLTAQDPFAGGAGPFSEPVQICRWHDFDEGTNRYRSGGLAAHGMHLPVDIFIPVRKLTVNVAEVPPVLTTLPTTLDFTMYPAPGAPLPSLQPGGRLFFPVAANILTATQALNYISPPSPDRTVLPDRRFNDITGDATEQVQEFLGDGLLYELALDAEAIPEEAATITVIFNVGDTALSAPISLTITVDGYFLARDTGALASGGYQITTGNSANLECVELDGATPVSPDDGSVTFTLRDGSPVPQVNDGGSLVDELTFSASGNQLTINVNSNANASLDGGFRRLLINDGGGTMKSSRTIQLV